MRTRFRLGGANTGIIWSSATVSKLSTTAGVAP
jgi:hypothetical protein